MDKVNHDLTTKPRGFPADPPLAGREISGSDSEATIKTEKKETAGKESSWDNKKNAKILLVEDNWDHAYLTIKYLGIEGRYQVELASSGSEALYKIAREKFSLLLVDYCMPDMNGLGLIKKIKELNYSIPIIMITGLGSESVAVEAMKNGAYDYVVKCGNYLEALPVLIDKALERYQLEKIKEEWDQWIFKRNRELGTLNSISAALGKSLRLDEVLKEAVDKTVGILRADYGRISLVEEIAESSFQDVRQAAEVSVGTVSKSSAVSEKGPSEEILQQVIRTGESLVLEDATEAPTSHRQEAPKEGLRSVGYLPLKSKEKVLGVMTVGSHRKLHFTREDIRLLNAIGNQIGSALESAKLYEEIRRQADRIKESENKYRALVEGANDAVLIVQGNRIQYANEKACELTGYSTEELYQTDFLDLVASDQKDTAATYYATKVSGKDMPNYETVMVRKDGREMILDISGSSIEYKGRPALQIIARNVTEQKHLREQLMRSKKLSALGQFVSGVAHEINNPLASVSGFAQILLQQEDLSESNRQILNKIYNETKRVAEIVHNLLSFARQRKLEKIPVDINELLERTIALRSYKLKTSNIELIKELDPNLPWALVDPIQMQLVFFNIIINAEQAMVESHKGGKLIIKTSLVNGPGYELVDKSENSWSSFGSWIKIEFIDDGPGIDKKSLAEIFDPFFTTKVISKGTGLGLSISYGIIKEHSGEIYALSEEGKGATFVVRLPVPKTDRAPFS